MRGSLSRHGVHARKGRGSQTHVFTRRNQTKMGRGRHTVKGRGVETAIGRGSNAIKRRDSEAAYTAPTLIVGGQVFL